MVASLFSYMVHYISTCTRYGLKVECDASSNSAKSSTPDACFFFADNLVVVDHNNGDVYILSLHDEYSSGNGDGDYQNSIHRIIDQWKLVDQWELIYHIIQCE
jgi:anthranilate/para-aminobenzoate synthase component I